MMKMNRTIYTVVAVQHCLHYIRMRLIDHRKKFDNYNLIKSNTPTVIILSTHLVTHLLI